MADAQQPSSPKAPPKPFRLFDVDDRYRKMAARRGGPARDQAIRQALIQIDQQKPQFDAWLDEDLKALTELVASAAGGQPGEDWLQAAADRSRGVRDIAKTLKLEILASVANALCAVLDVVLAKGGEVRIDALQRHVEAIALARGHALRGLSPDRMSEMDDSLRAVVARVAKK